VPVLLAENVVGAPGLPGGNDGGKADFLGGSEEGEPFLLAAVEAGGLIFFVGNIVGLLAGSEDGEPFLLAVGEDGELNLLAGNKVVLLASSEGGEPFLLAAVEAGEPIFFVGNKVGLLAGNEPLLLAVGEACDPNLLTGNEEGLLADPALPKGAEVLSKLFALPTLAAFSLELSAVACRAGVFLLGSPAFAWT
jgi:hypothetical protein